MDAEPLAGGAQIILTRVERGSETSEKGLAETGELLTTEEQVDKNRRVGDFQIDEL